LCIKLAIKKTNFILFIQCILIMNCTLWLALYCIVLRAYVGWYIEWNEEERLQWFGHVRKNAWKRLRWRILEWEPERTRNKARHKGRWMDRIITMGTEEDNRDSDMWGHLVYCTVDRCRGRWLAGWNGRTDGRTGGRSGEGTTDRTRRAMYCNVTSRRVRVTTVSMEKQYIFWVCVFSKRYPASNTHTPYYIVICDLSGSTTIPQIILYNAGFTEKEAMWHKMCVLSFSTTFVWNVSHSK
jgi:hypothetical protein